MSERGRAASTPAVLTGWGRTAPSAARLLTPTSREQVIAALQDAPARGLIARGLGRSYGDPAQNAGGLVLDVTGLNRILDVDLSAGLVRCEAGVSLHQLTEALLPFGYFTPVTPGTRQVTIGGAIACDVHGKNHHADGSFAQHVTEIELLLADGSVRAITPEEDPDTFWATAGGMGLTGVVLTATIRMVPVRTSSIVVDTVRTPDLDATLAALAATDRGHRFSVAWLDCLARGARLGRSVVEGGVFAEPEHLSGRARRDPLRLRARPLLRAPDVFPNGLLNRHTIAAFNEAWYRKAPRRQTGHVRPLTSFFHPLDAITDWNRVYGRAGFVQYQFVVPFGAEAALREIIERISAAGAPSFVTVLKRFGAQSPGFLSFPRPGWTLALDFPTRTPGLADLLDRLDHRVLSVDGRIYLAKDARLEPALLPRMYPGLDRLREVRAKLDPDGLFVSDQARRLGIVPGRG
jgi:decaprenylphospho-beta-D-ribofuranose 2-oxidase